MTTQRFSMAFGLAVLTQAAAAGLDTPSATFTVEGNVDGTPASMVMEFPDVTNPSPNPRVIEVLGGTWTFAMLGYEASGGPVGLYIQDNNPASADYLGFAGDGVNFIYAFIPMEPGFYGGAGTTFPDGEYDLVTQFGIGPFVVHVDGGDQFEMEIQRVFVDYRAAGEPQACNDADLAEPFGVLDLTDIVGFVSAFSAQSPAADFDGDGVFDLDDIVGFVTLFSGGCP